MTIAELIDLFRNVERSNHPVCNGCPMKYTCDKNQITRCLFGTAADALEADEKRIKELEMSFSDVCNANGSLACERNKLLNDVRELEAQLPKEGEWLRTDAFPHRVYCSCCYKTYVPNENWQIWQDDADNFGLPRNYCPNCGARMKGEQG